jgi:hypothetical protein
MKALAGGPAGASVARALRLNVTSRPPAAAEVAIIPRRVRVIPPSP